MFCIYKKYNNFDVYFYPLSKQIDSKLSSDGHLPTLQLTTSHSQRSNSEKPLWTGCCEWL